MKDPIIQLREGEKVPFEMPLWQIIRELNHLKLLETKLKKTTKVFLNSEEVEPPEDTRR